MGNETNRSSVRLHFETKSLANGDCSHENEGETLGKVMINLDSKFKKQKTLLARPNVHSQGHGLFQWSVWI